MAFIGDTSTSPVKKDLVSGSQKKYNTSPIDEIEDNHFILLILEEKLNYQTIKDQFDLNINSERSFPNRFDESKTDKEVTVSLLNDSSTAFSYYLSHSKNIFLKGIIYTPQLILAKGVKVGISRTEIGKIFNCTPDSTKNQFKIYDVDGLTEVILNFNSSGNIIFIDINTSVYVS